MHWTLLQAPSPDPPPDMGHEGPLPVRSGGHYWKPVQTCSLDLTVWGPSGTDIWWPPKDMWLASRQYASYWNTFLLWNVFTASLWSCRQVMILWYHWSLTGQMRTPSPAPNPHHTRNRLAPASSPNRNPLSSVLLPWTHHFGLSFGRVHTCSICSPDWEQAGGWYATEMPSCFHWMIHYFPLSQYHCHFQNLFR